MGGEDQEWRVSKASQSCMAIHRRTYCFWISMRIHYRSLCSCHKHIMGAKEVKNGCALSMKQLLNTFFQDFSPHTPSSNFFFPPPTPQANPTSQTQHSPIKHMCVCVCVSSSLSLSMAGLWQQLSSLRQGRALALLHFILYLPSGALPGDTNASPPPLEVRHPHCHGKKV